MKTFHCNNCNMQVFHENVRCERCGYLLGFLEDEGKIHAFAPNGDGVWRILGSDAGDRRFKQCHNYAVENVCNRMIALEDPHHLCGSCQLTAIIPTLDVGRNRVYWFKLARAKRRLLYTLAQLGLPIVSRKDDPETGLAFEFLESTESGPKVHTGHSDGVITINIAEADDSHREAARARLKEPYRTLLGHFRHEIGHYYFMRLMHEGPLLDECRTVFGNDELDYGDALKRHYTQGPPADWRESFVSSYATMHPYEDWAETWAHYMHMVDTLETAAACGMSLTPAHPEEPTMPAEPVDTVTQSFDHMIERWFPLTYALNSLNRSMGTRDSYPFTLMPPVIEKLRFIHRVIQMNGQAKTGSVIGVAKG